MQSEVFCMKEQATNRRDAGPSKKLTTAEKNGEEAGKEAVENFTMAHLEV